jgi:transposase
MPAERLSMRKVREVLRLKYACGVSERVISRSLGIGRTAVAEYIRRAAVIGITWPIAAEFDDTALERKLFAPAGYNPPHSKPLPDWNRIHSELRRRGVTLALLWQEYRAGEADGYGYSRFCDLYGEWRRGITATMRQTHAAGEKLFVDFAGDTIAVLDAASGQGASAKSSSRFWERRTTPMRKPASARRCPSGFARMSTHSRSWAAFRKQSFATISKPG